MGHAEPTRRSASTRTSTGTRARTGTPRRCRRRRCLPGGDGLGGPRGLAHRRGRRHPVAVWAGRGVAARWRGPLVTIAVAMVRVHASARAQTARARCKCGAGDGARVHGVCMACAWRVHGEWRMAAAVGLTASQPTGSPQRHERRAAAAAAANGTHLALGCPAVPHTCPQQHSRAQRVALPAHPRACHSANVARFTSCPRCCRHSQLCGGPVDPRRSLPRDRARPTPCGDAPRAGALAVARRPCGGRQVQGPAFPWRRACPAAAGRQLAARPHRGERTPVAQFAPPCSSRPCIDGASKMARVRAGGQG